MSRCKKVNDVVKVGGGAFYAEAITFEAFRSRLRLFLGHLGNLHPAFRQLGVVLSDGLIARVSGDPADLDQAVERACDQQAERCHYIDAVDDGSLKSDTKHERGFTVRLLSDEGLEIVVRAGGRRVAETTDVLLTIPTSSSNDFKAEKLVQTVLAYCLDDWNLAVAYASSPPYEQIVREKEDSYSGQWLLYLPLSHLSTCLPNQISAKPWHAGTLIKISSHFPSADDEMDVASGRYIREKLDELGLIRHCHYAIHGWPPDEEEWRYEEFISGAPRGRKYRVRCIDFDGYDAKRDVLLYAKLFRRLRTQRKEWGLRGWDGPVLNEARRQVRAANGTQIEWHIGLEEPAARVRTLLADYTDFKEEQLRVVYTPASQMATR